MQRLRFTTLDRFRKILDRQMNANVVVLAGAGVSMIPPTVLPSGDSLRDDCVSQLLSDGTSRRVIGRLLRTPAYRALLPEAVLQLIGSTVGSGLDRFMKRILSPAVPNVVHAVLVERGYRIFTTNFDICFEKAGGFRIRHLHGQIRHPDTLQNQLYRLGKTALKEATQFASAARGTPLLVLGYSFRDDDIVELVKSNIPAKILYLSFDGAIPTALLGSKSPVLVAKGAAEDLFRVTPCATSAPRLRHSPVRLPAVRHRANALLRICSRAGLYEIQSRMLHSYLPQLSGRAKLLAMCEVADSLRKARQFSRAETLTKRVISDPAARSHASKDAVSTALVQCGLIAIDRGDKDYDRIERFFQEGLRIFEELVATEPPGKYEAENDIWRARILNNLGLVSMARGDYPLSVSRFGQSVDLKIRHHERYGIAQTYGNLAKAQILQGRLSEAATTLAQLVAEARLTPDPYICNDSISGCLAALRDTRRLILRIRTEAAVSQPDRWWRRLVHSPRATKPMRRILSNLNELRTLHTALRLP